LFISVAVWPARSRIQAGVFHIADVVGRRKRRLLDWFASPLGAPLFHRVTVHGHVRASPAGLSEEMFQQIDQVVDADSRTGKCLGWSIVGPVDHERFADYIVAGYEPCKRAAAPLLGYRPA